MKPIKIDLIFNGARVSNLEELRGSFSMDILKFHEDGSLLTWLKTRGLMTEAQSLLEISTENQAERLLSLCKILGVPYNLNAKDNDALLYLAVCSGHKDVVDLLIAKGADVNANDNEGFTPLHRAVSCEHLHMVDLLITKGAYINPKDNDGSTPLHRAISCNNKDMVDLLITKGADVNSNDNEGFTPLHRAARKGHMDIVKLLTDINAKYKSGIVHHRFIVSNSPKDAVDLSMTKVADVNANDNVGCTPLHHAASNGHRDVVDLLIAQGAVINAKDNDGVTPLHFADSNGHKDVSELLIKKLREITCPHCGKESKFREPSLGECVTDVAKFAAGALLWNPLGKAIKLSNASGNFPNFVCISCGKKIMQCGRCNAMIPYADFGSCPHCGNK